MQPDKPIVIAFCGLKGHGKDTAASVLIEKEDFVRVSFADGLKECVALALRVDVGVLHDPVLKESLHTPSGKTYRQWLQIAGTEWFRSMWEDVWVEWWKHEVISKGYKRVVVTDMRFWNELNIVRSPEFDSHVIRVSNPNKPAAFDTHESEKYAALFNVDTDILNNADIATLRNRTLTAFYNFYN